MATEVKASGTLTFESKKAIKELAFEVDRDDESTIEVQALLDEGVRRKGPTLTLSVDGQLTAEANMWFQDWLEDIAGEAVEGHLDTWQESFGPSMFVRLHAGGEEEQIDTPFPT